MGKKMHYAGADGVRGLACLIVLCVHAAMMFFTNSSSGLAGTGKIGVWLFFVLSAFLLTSKFAAVGFSFYSIATYALGRVVRIIPLFSLVAGRWLILFVGHSTNKYSSRFGECGYDEAGVRPFMDDSCRI